VLWVYASNAARFEQSFRDIADNVKLTGRQDPQANIFKLVHDWLSRCKQRWLLVLDNVDDARFLVERPAADSKIGARPLREYLPHCDRGSVLVTTRNKQAALKLVEQRDIVEVEPMDEPSALLLLEKKLGTQADDSKTTELAAALEYMPLAIVQAAAYISQRAPRYSVVTYLDDYRKNERKRTSLLEYDDGQLRRDWEAKNSIIVTWQMSFEYIQHTRPSAAELLSLMSFFDRQGIPENLLRHRGNQEEDDGDQQGPMTEATDTDVEDDVLQSGKSVESEEDTFEDDVVALRNFCFISDETGGMNFEMHALVQLATRTWLTTHGKLERWKQQFISNLSAAFPTGAYKNWAVCGPLFAHAKAAAEQQPEDVQALVEWATLIYHAAWYAEQSGNVADAEELAVASLKTRRKVLGQEHQDTIWSIAIVADAYSLGGQWDKAEKLRKQVMETRKKELGADHPDTLTSMANLASTYRNQGRWDAAEELEVQVMETSKKKLGADHPDTLTSMANLASTYRNQGRWDAAEELEVQVMETRKKKLGADHPDTLTSMANLGVTYSVQGKEEKAEPLKKQVMETSKKKLGADHPSTLTSMGNLASTYRNQGRWDAAEELEVQVMETRKKKLGADHPDTLTSMANLASTYRNQGRWDAAEELFVQVMETRKKKLGADHPSTLTSMANLAFTWKAQGQNVEAISLMRHCVQQRQEVLKASHPDLASSLTILQQWEAE
jgi:tetratricopeptide (TPR) repeat protein